MASAMANFPLFPLEIDPKRDLHHEQWDHREKSMQVTVELNLFYNVSFKGPCAAAGVMDFKVS